MRIGECCQLYDMQRINESFDLEKFWERLRQAPQALLLLDFDGTLSPFVADPNKARPYPGMVTLLKNIELCCRTRLVIISGREVESLKRCLGMTPVPELWGCHGWQRQLADGRLQQVGLPPNAEALLRQAEQLAQEAGYAENLERKPVSLALHWRGLDTKELEKMQKRLVVNWYRLIEAGSLQLHDFDGGIELRCPGVDKGTAVNQLLDEVDKGTLVAYLGDDVTDEDAFKALGERGLKVLVRTQCRVTAADFWLQPPEELNWFLRQWIEERGGPSARST